MDDDGGVSSAEPVPTASQPLFSPAEWLCLLPAAREPQTRVSTFAALVPTNSDPAAALRTARPLTPAEMRNALDVDGGALLRAALTWQLRISEVGRVTLLPMTVLSTAALAALTAAMVLFNTSGRYPTASLGVGLAAIWAFWGAVFAQVWAGLNQLIVQGYYRGKIRKNDDERGPKQLPATQDLSRHPFATMARWLQLFGAEKAPSDAGSTVRVESTKGVGLVSHVDGDRDCSCFACARSLVPLAGILRVMEFTVRYAFALSYIVVSAPALLSYPVALWTTPWTAIAAVMFLLPLAMGLLVSPAARVPTNLALLDLESRLHRRALLLALREFLDRYARVVSAGGGTSEASEAAIISELAAPADEIYVALFRSLVSVWKDRFPALLTGTAFLSRNVVIPVAAAVACVAAGSCVPLWIILVLAACFVLLVMDLVNHAAANAQIGGCVSLLGLARAEARELLAASASRPGPAREALAQHAELMAALAGSAGSGARFFGAVVSYGVVRAAAATVLTVAIGLWGVLRGTGVRVEIAVACAA
ncbi:hypothetical protein DFJ74DRAFT_759146 [Hyaloraphidium curvatum]|nr:hypothetical protein DFJ74DRAFT_759146 [Hyaloraphidium curvatum]